MSNFNSETDSSAFHETLLRDRFELLSAYVDGEVSAAERRQVEEWLSNDPTVQQLHSRLMRLHQAFETMPAPVATQSHQEIANAVFERVEQRARRRWFLGGLAALAAVAVAAVSVLLPGEQSPIPQLANESTKEVPVKPGNGSEPLLIALDKPLVDIPKSPVAPDGASKGLTPEREVTQ